MNPAIFIGVAFSVLVAIINIAVLITVKFNDLVHLQRDLTELKITLKEHSTKIISIAEDVAHLKGKLCNKSKKR